MEKAKAIVGINGICYDTIGDEYWVKSESGKTWELWLGGKFDRLLTRKQARLIAWVIPFPEGGLE